MLAYACSIHKSQGSEYPAVIVLLTHSTKLLQRNLLYTPSTRGKRLVMVVGSSRAVNIAIKNKSASGAPRYASGCGARFNGVESRSAAEGEFRI